MRVAVEYEHEQFSKDSSEEDPIFECKVEDEVNNPKDGFLECQT